MLVIIALHLKINSSSSSPSFARAMLPVVCQYLAGEARLPLLRTNICIPAHSSGYTLLAKPMKLSKHTCSLVLEAFFSHICMYNSSTFPSMGRANTCIPPHSSRYRLILGRADSSALQHEIPGQHCVLVQCNVFWSGVVLLSSAV